MKVSEIWGLLKPVIIIVLAVIGYFSATAFVPRNIFLSVAILSFMFRGASIWKGFKAIYNAIKN